MSKVKGVVFNVCQKFLEKYYTNSQIEKFKKGLTIEEFDVLQNADQKAFYPLEYYIHINKAIVQHFGNNDISIIKKVGRYGADIAVRGIFSFLYNFGSPDFIIKRGTIAFDKYFDDAHLYVISSTKNSVVGELKGFENLEKNLIKYICKRIEGWIERSLEISSGKSVKTFQSKCIAKGDPSCVFVSEW